MKKLLTVLLFVMAVSFAQAETLQLGLFNPIQLVPEGSSVEACRLGLIYTKNASVNGIDANWLVSQTTGTQEGVQLFGVLNIVQGGGKGIQLFNGINYTKGSREGVQFAVVNFNENMKGVVLGTVNISQNMDGFEWGFVNASKQTKGIQLGMFNFTQQLQGFQIGFINVYTQGTLPVLPLINGNFNF